VGGAARQHRNMEQQAKRTDRRGRKVVFDEVIVVDLLSVQEIAVGILFISVHDKAELKSALYRLVT